MSDERELNLEVVDEPVVRGGEFALLLFGQGDVKTIVDGNPCLGGDPTSTRRERKVWNEHRAGGHDVEPEGACFG